jgi:hypothetical protein
MDPIVCPNCGKQVVPGLDGSCPSCRFDLARAGRLFNSRGAARAGQPAGAPRSASLVVARINAVSGSGLKYPLFLDDAEVYALANGEEHVFSLRPGEHTLFFKTWGGQTSPKTSFRVGTDECLKFFCGVRFNGEMFIGPRDLGGLTEADRQELGQMRQSNERRDMITGIGALGAFAFFVWSLFSGQAPGSGNNIVFTLAGGCIGALLGAIINGFSLAYKRKDRRLLGINLEALGGLALGLTLLQLYRVGFPRLAGPEGRAWQNVLGILASYAILALLAAAVIGLGSYFTHLEPRQPKK